MTVKKLRYLAYALVAVAFCACQKEPSTSGLHKDYLVYTAYDTEADFGALRHLLPPRQHPADRRRRQDGILERRQCAGDRQHGRRPHERRRLHPYRRQRCGQSRPAAQLCAESDLFRGLRLSLLVVVLSLLLDARLLGRLGRAGTIPTAFTTDIRPVRCSWR